MLRHAVLLLCLALLPWAALAAPQALDDAALSEVRGAGIGLSVSLSLNAGLLDGQTPQPDLVAGFRDGSRSTYLVLHGLGGRMDLHGLTLDMLTRSDGGPDTLALGLPGWVGLERFGVRGLAVQDDAASLLSPVNSLGGLWLQGTLSLQGRLLMWSR